jgi:O-antigen/teichoic acid export membrane protein
MAGDREGGARSGARAARGSSTYAAAAFLQRGIGFLMLPIYTRALTPAEYGQLAVVLTVATAAGTLLSFGLETAIFRTWFQMAGNPRDRERFVNTVGLFLLVVPGVITLVLIVTLGPTIGAAFSVPAGTLAIGLAAIVVGTVATTLPMALVRAQERLRAYLLLTAIFVVSDTALMVWLVVLVPGGIYGWLIATLASYAVLLVAGLLVLGHRWTGSFEWRHLRFALAFGLPLLPHAISHWALSLSDRAVLGAFVSPNEVGVYNLAYQLALPISILTVALHQGVMPLYAHASAEASVRRELSLVVTNQIFVTVYLGLGAALLGPPFVLIVMPAAYAQAADALPWIGWGLTAFGLYLIPMDAITVMAGRTRWVWIATVVAAAANISLNLLLVPRYGMLAAAWDTAIAYLVLLVAIYGYMLRVTESRVSYEWTRILLGTGTIVASLALGIIVTPGGSPEAAFAIRSLILVVALIVMWRIARWHRSHDAGRPLSETTP